MQLEKIVSLANKTSALRFLAMVRSLRATGCNLPVWVIPFDDNRFDLPENCIWWEIKELSEWLDANHAHKTMRKYQCLLTTNFQFVDADVVFLTNPEHTLANVNGWITSCGHWHNPAQTYTDSSLIHFKNASTTWQRNIFNSGQFACDVQLYDFKTLKETAENPMYADTALHFVYHEQPGLNLLVHVSKVPVHNLTLPPFKMESTWAGDYWENYARYWTSEERKPYIIHYAGCQMDMGRPIDELYFNLLSPEEKQEWDASLRKKRVKENKWNKKVYRNLRRIKHALASVKFE